MKLYVPAAFGLEQVVKRQLNKLGYDNCPAFNGRIAVEGGWTDVARINMFIRSGERVLVEVGSFRAATFDELYGGFYSIPWENYLTVHSQILMDGKSVKSTLGAIKASGSVAKKAIIRRLIDKKRLNCRNLDETGPRTIVGFSIYNDEVSVTIDTTGDGLHKRGYRTLAYTAPLKETLAAALIDMSYYFPDKVFADPFCGSGTLPVEAAIKSLNIAPGKNRRFDFMDWKFVPEDAYALALEEAKDGEELSKKVEIYGSDINPEAISIAKYHAKRAGVDGKITFKTMDMRKFSSKEKRGVMISNPPYGERLDSEDEVKAICKDLGVLYKSLPDWNMYILSGYPEFERNFGRRADKTKKLYNANIQCNFYSFLSSKPQKE
ncbi:MAG: class I SAM-dependent RNA methyltransferase [Clostridia bacterium]|nr:class I SAM-dependent RNA methyltransferase [Clostridia bacterium]